MYIMLDEPTLDEQVKKLLEKIRNITKLEALTSLYHYSTDPVQRYGYYMNIYIAEMQKKKMNF